MQAVKDGNAVDARSYVLVNSAAEHVVCRHFSSSLQYILMNWNESSSCSSDEREEEDVKKWSH